MNPSVVEPEQLSAAFAQFNQHSSRLEASYRELSDRVAVLTRQLKTEQDARHRELLETERLGNRLLRIVEALPGAVLVLDAGGVIRECNRRAAHLLAQPLIGLAWADIVQRECAAKTNSDGDLWLKDGRCLSLSRQSLSPEPGEILLLTDVSDSRRMAELMQRASRLSTMGEMTAGLAHQIRTPIASALLNAALLEGGTRQLELADRIQCRLREVGTIVDDMLCFAAGERRLHTEFSVADTFREVAETFDPALGDDELLVEFPPQDMRVAGNRAAVKGALCNLIDNARQAAGSAPRIVLAADCGDDTAFLSVRDNGPGIPEHLRSQLFEPFFTTRPQGTGLGLAVVRSVADAHGGDVLVESGAVGSTFTLCLPLYGDHQ